MQSATVEAVDVDVVQELRMRRWARENYVPAAERDANWHPIVLAEMRSKESEMQQSEDYRRVGGALVPLPPGTFRMLHGPHDETMKAKTLLSVPAIAD